MDNGQFYCSINGVLLRSDSCVASTIEAIQLPINGRPPKFLRTKTRIVEIITKPIVTPKAQPIPRTNPSLKSLTKDLSFTEIIVANFCLC